MQATSIRKPDENLAFWHPSIILSARRTWAPTNKRTGGNEVGCAGHLWRNKKLVVVAEGEAAPVKGPVVVMAQRKAVGWVVVAEQRKVPNMAGVQNAAVADTDAQAADRAGVVIDGVDDFREQGAPQVFDIAFLDCFRGFRLGLALRVGNKFIHLCGNRVGGNNRLNLRRSDAEVDLQQVGMVRFTVRAFLNHCHNTTSKQA